MLKALVVILLLCANARALTRDEFQRLAEDLAPKVNLFRDVWALDAAAEMAGGTTRDFLYWVKGELRKGRTPQELRALPTIDVRDFIVHDSDVDILVRRRLSLDERKYGVRRFDYLAQNMDHDDLFDQGFLPVENIRLGKNGFLREPRFGDGVGEIFSGRPTLHPPDPERFPKTRYAAAGLNHEVLLGLRYLRILALNYFHAHGRGHPGPSLIQDIDPSSARAARELIGKALQPGELVPFMRRPKFAEWINGTIRKGFRAYTSPSAAMALYRHFGADQLPNVHHDIAPINQYLFARPVIDEQVLRERLAAMSSAPERFYVDPSVEFADGMLYHGTKTEDAFEAILRQGILPSVVGSAGPGLYAVKSDNLAFAENWGGSRERLVKFHVNRDARVVDITGGEGRRVYEAFGGGIEAFAEHFGVDVLCYPYTTRAYVVKNSEALGRPQGVTRQVMTLSRILEHSLGADTLDKARAIFESIHLSQFTKAEVTMAVQRMPVFATDRFKPAAALMGNVLPAQLASTLGVLGDMEKLESGLMSTQNAYLNDPAYREFFSRWLLAIGAEDPARLDRALKAARAPHSRHRALWGLPSGTWREFRKTWQDRDGWNNWTVWLAFGGFVPLFAGITWMDIAQHGKITNPIPEVCFAGLLYVIWGGATVTVGPYLIARSMYRHWMNYAAPRAVMNSMRGHCRAALAGLG